MGYFPVLKRTLILAFKKPTHMQSPTRGSRHGMNEVEVNTAKYFRQKDVEAKTKISVNKILSKNYRNTLFLPFCHVALVATSLAYVDTFVSGDRVT